LILSKTSFSRLKNLQHLEEISSTPPTHLERLLLFATFYALPQKDSPFLCLQVNTFKNLKTSFPKTFTRNLKNFSYTSNFNVENFNNLKNFLPHIFSNLNVENLKKLEELSFTLLNLKLET
jgi:hypothetical protein